MEVDTLNDDHVMKRVRTVDKLSNDIHNNLHVTQKNAPPSKDVSMGTTPPKEENILVLLERMSKNKEMRNNKVHNIRGEEREGDWRVGIFNTPPRENTFWYC